MKTMLFKKTILTALIAALLLAALPLTGVSAAGQTDPTPPAQGQISNERLEKVWARMNRRYERLGRIFEKSDGLVERVNALIERLKEAGESTAELEAALAAYEDAVKQAHPIYESCNGIVNSHKGFDADGKVTDAEQARETIKELGAKFDEIKTAMNGTGKALIELLKSIREAHKPANL
jgi:chromosome segregation ATPase